MSADKISVRFDLSGTFRHKTLFDISPSQKNDDHIFINRQERLHAKITKTELGLKVEISDFARPAPTVTLQGSLSLEGGIRT